MSLAWESRALGLFARLEAGRRLAVVVDHLRSGVRHHESDAALLFLDQMCDESCRAREQRHALETGKWKASVQEHGRDRPGNIQRQGTTKNCRHEPLDEPGDFDVPARDAGLSRYLQQASGAWIAAAVQGMAVSRDRTLRFAVLAHHRGGGVLETRG